MTRITLAAIAGLAAISTADAHYPWLTIGKGGKHGVANFYFEHSPAVGDGHYLDPFLKRGELWFHQKGKDAVALKKNEEKIEAKKKRWLSAVLPAKSPRCIECYAKWGVYRYGKTDVLLHYYARNYQAAARRVIAEFQPKSKLEFRIEPIRQDDELHLRLMWKDKPVAGGEIIVGGPGYRKTLKTDEKGHAHFEPTRTGRYLFRAFRLEKENAGEFEGKKYSRVHRHTTMIMFARATEKKKPNAK